MFRPIAFALVLTFAAQASAAPLSVRVTGPSGKPVANAVVSLPSARPSGGGHYVLSQKDLAFQPFVLVVPLGATVSFPNFDDTRHHVYSFSKAKRFELKLFAREQSRTVRFDAPGIVALGCNIHDQMSAFIIVSDRAAIATTDRNGVARLNAPSGPAASRLTVWHPYLRAPGNSVAISVFPGETNKSVQVRLRPPPMHGMSGY